MTKAGKGMLVVGGLAIAIAGLSRMASDPLPDQSESQREYEKRKPASQSIASQRTTNASCEITGTIPPELQEPICNIASSAHGGGEPSNQLTVMLTPALAMSVRAKDLEAENMLQQLLGAWMRTRKVRVARVEAFYGSIHLATVETHAYRSPSVEFH